MMKKLILETLEKKKIEGIQLHLAQVVAREKMQHTINGKK